MGSSSSHPDGFSAATSSRIFCGAASPSYSSGLTASGSAIFSLVPVLRPLSVGSSISAGGFNGRREGLGGCRFTRVWSIEISKVLSGLTTSRSRGLPCPLDLLQHRPALPPSIFLACFSSMAPVLGWTWR